MMFNDTIDSVSQRAASFDKVDGSSASRLMESNSCVAGVYPFFLKCAEKATTDLDKLRYERLAFGLGVLIRQGNGGRHVLVGERGREFCIPGVCNETSFEAVKTFLESAFSNANDDKSERAKFEQIENDILKSRAEWRSVRKKERIRLIDEYARNRFNDSKTRYKARVFITIALLLKLITSRDISYSNFSIRNIRGRFFDFSFNNDDDDEEKADNHSRTSDTIDDDDVSR